MCCQNTRVHHGVIYFVHRKNLATLRDFLLTAWLLNRFTILSMYAFRVSSLYILLKYKFNVLELLILTLPEEAAAFGVQVNWSNNQDPPGFFSCFVPCC